jgi:hypothetical protein
MENNQINISKYLSVAIGVAEASGSIMRKILDSGELQ